jgi:ferrous iron transport protein B
MSTIILVGNPNVGKSVLFSKLTGKFVVISNYPGTTVEITRGEMLLDGAKFTVIDSPGVNELAPRTEDARVTCDVIRDHPDAVIVQVADAKNLRRALLVTHQLAQQQRRVVLVLNMMDELDQCGGHIDARKLSELLGIPVVPTIATANTGIHLVQKSVGAASVPQFGLVVRRGSPDRAVPADRQVSTGGAGDLRSQEVRGQETCAQPGLPAINELLAQTYSHVRPRRASLLQQLGWWATHPFKGLALVALALYITFWFVGLFGAGTCVDVLETGVFNRFVSPWAIRAVDAVLPFPHQHETEKSELKLEIPFTPAHSVEVWSNEREVLSANYKTETTGVVRFVHDFFVGPYGLITMAFSYGFAIVLPIVTTFFLLFGVLEDSGYLPRLAVMVNRLFRAMGLNGKAVLPIVLGLGCDTMATMTTRILETRKERVITTLLLALAVPCSAQLGVLLAMMASISAPAAAFWFLLMVGVTFLIGWLAAKLYKGDTSDFILELPPMRRPLLGNVAVKTFARLEWYLKEVIPLFVLGTAMLFLLDKLDLLDKIARVGEPLVKGWLGLPKETAQAFLVGFLRRDYGAVFLLDAAKSGAMTPRNVLVAMVTITLFMPCIATLFMIARELGKKTAVWITVFVFVFAFLVGGLVDKAAHWMGF